MPDPAFAGEEIAAAFEQFPRPARHKLLQLRQLVFATANETEGVGELEETLKWGQPAYLTSRTKSGSTLRLGMTKCGEVALFAHCQTTIIAEFVALFPGEFRTDGNRAILFDAGDDLPLAKLRLLVKCALTYRQRRRR